MVNNNSDIWFGMLSIAFTLLILLSPLDAWDGCGHGKMRCGNLCTSRKNNCTCGNKTLKLEKFRVYRSWCCVQESGNCTNTTGDITCPDGKYQDLTMPCFGGCNYFPEDPNNAYRSYKLCDANLDSSLNIQPHCVWESKFGNGEYDCINREDEQPFRKAKKKKQEIPLVTHPSTCNHIYGPGLNCSGYLPTKCLSYAGWCRPLEPFACPAELGTLLSQDKTLCSNSSFWAGLPCTSVLGEGKRCRGENSGQCVYPLSSYDYVTLRNCEDKSDQVHNFNSTCPSYSEEDHPQCTKDLRKFCGFSKFGKAEKYEKYQRYWDACLSCFDPTNCIGSCAQPKNVATNYSKELHTHCKYEKNMIESCFRIPFY